MSCALRRWANLRDCTECTHMHRIHTCISIEPLAVCASPQRRVFHFLPPLSASAVVFSPAQAHHRQIHANHRTSEHNVRTGWSEAREKLRHNHAHTVHLFSCKFLGTLGIFLLALFFTLFLFPLLFLTLLLQLVFSLQSPRHDLAKEYTGTTTTRR